MRAKVNASATRTQSLRRTVLGWYRKNRRDLPWRRTRDPYAIWVSEIMLQQTRVAAVLEHYREFLNLFPTVEALASAEIDSVLAAWSGLGYYRRARGLHEAAKKVVSEHQGVLPSTRDGLRKLPGIGRYTAAAIASIAFGEPHAVVDGNVERVLARIDGKRYGSSEVWVRAQELLDVESPGDFNQAMMELGATICTPVSPACDRCPVAKLCKAPGATTNVEQPERKRANLTVGLALKPANARENPTHVYLRQRGASESLMPLMWELPSAEDGEDVEVYRRFRHSITNTDYSINVVLLGTRGIRGGRWFKLDELRKLPLTGVARKVLSSIGITLHAKSVSQQK